MFGRTWHWPMGDSLPEAFQSMHSMSSGRCGSPLHSFCMGTWNRLQRGFRSFLITSVCETDQSEGTAFAICCTFVFPHVGYMSRFRRMGWRKQPRRNAFYFLHELSRCIYANLRGPLHRGNAMRVCRKRETRERHEGLPYTRRHTCRLLLRG